MEAMECIKHLRNYAEALGCRCEEQALMEKYTTFRTGGPAELMIHVQNGEQAAAVLKKSKELELPLRILGKGSNLLVSDNGVGGVVLYLEPSKTPFLLENNCVTAWAGESLSALCLFALEEEKTGLEFAYGIPGSIGGAVYMNAGAYGGEVKDCLKWVRFLDSEQNMQTLSGEELDLSYRHSIFCGKDWLILEACFELKDGKKEDIKAIMDDVMFKRRDKQPLEHPSAGSTFKRPEGAFAAALIDQCGLKGRRVGGVCISEKHAGFLVNDKGGCSDDILKLIAIVHDEVLEKTGYDLETEVEYWEK